MNLDSAIFSANNASTFIKGKLGYFSHAPDQKRRDYTLVWIFQILEVAVCYSCITRGQRHYQDNYNYSTLIEIHLDATHSQLGLTGRWERLSQSRGIAASWWEASQPDQVSLIEWFWSSQPRRVSLDKSGWSSQSSQSARVINHAHMYRLFKKTA